MFPYLADDSAHGNPQPLCTRFMLYARTFVARSTPHVDELPPPVE